MDISDSYQNIISIFVRSAFCAALFLTCGFLGGCEWVPMEERSLVAETDPVALRIAEAADKASSALQSLAKMEQSQKPIQADAVFEGAPEELMRKVTIDWTGPVEPLLATLADRAGYQFTVIGSPSPTPAVVSVNVIDRPIVEQLRSVGLQVTGTADVVVDAGRKVVELQYAPRK